MKSFNKNYPIFVDPITRERLTDKEVLAQLATNPNFYRDGDRINTCPQIVEYTDDDTLSPAPIIETTPSDGLDQIDKILQQINTLAPKLDSVNICIGLNFKENQ